MTDKKIKELLFYCKELKKKTLSLSGIALASATATACMSPTPTKK